MNNKIKLNWILKRARFTAFTVVELMIVMLVFAIVGGVTVSAFFITVGSYSQAEDHVNAAREVEFAMNTLRPQFSNIGLGMPNNSASTGSFNISFTGPIGSNPVMAYMGDRTWSNRSWGGPVTLGVKGAHTDITNPSFLSNTPEPGTRAFAGEELFYVWSVPTRIRLQRGSDWNNGKRVFSSESTEPISFKFLESGDVRKLVDYVYDYGRRIGVTNSNRGANVRSWIVFPSFRVPLLIEEDGTYYGIDQTNDIIRASVSPYSYDSLAADYTFEGSLQGYEEVHLVQAACIYAENGNLIQRIYEDVTNFTDIVLATNVLGVYFVFDDDRRILTMYTVACGNTYAGIASAYNREYLMSKLPSHVPISFIDNADRGYRILVESMTWRIRN